MCIALVGVMAFWVVLNYFTQKTEAFGNNYVGYRDEMIRAASK